MEFHGGLGNQFTRNSMEISPRRIRTFSMEFVFVVVNCFTSGNLLCLFLGIVMYANKVETKKNENYLR